MKKYLDSFLLDKNVVDNKRVIAVYSDEEDYLQYFPRKKELFILNEFLDEFEAMLVLLEKNQLNSLWIGSKMNFM
jgi:hypothetical protein